MANYRESALAGNSYTRCKELYISNPMAGMGSPRVTFIEEEVLNIDANTRQVDAGSCKKIFNSPELIALRNPITSELTGDTLSHEMLYVILYSLYMQTALERDAALEITAQ